MILGHGAESIVELRDGNVIKIRPKKSYRLPVIDDLLRKTRTRREAKVLLKLQNIVSVPKLISADDVTMTLVMEHIKGEKLVDVFNVSHTEKIGKMIGLVHQQDIIHGDLTTSNIMLRDKDLVLIDFGLSFFSERMEDKAVDLHLLFEAIKSKHYQYYDKARLCILSSYRETYSGADAVLLRLQKVELRGRNKQG